MILAPISNLLKHDAIIFASDYGRKAVTSSWTVRLNNQIKQLDQVKEFQNINLATGRDSLLVDVDLDCEEANLLADHLLTNTEMKFGRASTPKAHRIYKVIDLHKNHTRKYFSFKGTKKSVIAEMRANKHYTVCWGQYDDGEKVVWSDYGMPTEITWDTLHKENTLLAIACVILRKFPTSGKHDEYIRLIVNTLWQHKVEQGDTEKVINAVLRNAGCNNCCTDGVVAPDKIGKVKSVYKKERSEQILGLPSLAKEFHWSEEEVKDFKALLFKATGRDALPEYTNEFINQIVYMMKQGLFYDLNDKEMYKGEAIDFKYAKYFNGKYTPLKYWKLHKDNKVAVDFTYKPNDPNRFVTINKKLMINVYEKNDLEPDPKADVDIFYNLVENLIPHDEYREHFLNWYAFNIQNKGVKIRHAMILQSDEFQVGKGSLFDLLRDILGHHNTRKIDLREALDKSKSYLIDRQVVLIDEAKASGSWSEKMMFLNTLKTTITEGTAGVRKLYSDYKEQDTVTNYIIYTNFRDAFPIPMNEARYWVYFSDAKRNQQLLDEFHRQRLNGNLPAGVLYEMLERDISKFDPLAPAPWTPFRDEMSKNADRPLNDWVKEKFEQGVFPLEVDLITASELFDYMVKETKVKVTRERDVAEALKLIGGHRKRGCPVKQVGKDLNIWIIRNHNKYSSKTAKELGELYTGFYTDKRNRS